MARRSARSWSRSRLAGEGFLLALGGDDAGIPAEGDVHQVLGEGGADDAAQAVGVGGLEVAHGGDVVLEEEVGDLRADAPERAQGFGGEPGQTGLSVGGHHEESVGLTFLAGELGEEFVRGHADGAGEACLGEDLGFDLAGDGLGFAEEAAHARDVQEGLVDGEAFD